MRARSGQRTGTITVRSTGVPFMALDHAPDRRMDREGRSPAIDAAHIERQREWSERTFGPGSRSAGVVDHIRRELVEIEADPSDLGEWVDVVILALDGAWRAGHDPQTIIDAIVAKQTRNEQRTWPDWRTMPTDRAIEHVRGGEGERFGPC